MLLLLSVVYRQAKRVARTIIRASQELSDQFLTLTFDNGLEFAAHETISDWLNVDIYFAQPYYFWERA